VAGPYELYLIRHGVAEERGEAWTDDAKRPLSEEGMTRMRKSIRGLARVDVILDIILTSPLVRTKQTAEIVAAGLDPRPPIVVVESLAPGGACGDPRRSREARRKRASASSATSRASASSRRA
jgi:phosphohistidine phosphatase